MQRVSMVEKVTGAVYNLVQEKVFVGRQRVREQDFTRERKLTFVDYIWIILRGGKRTLEAGIRGFANAVRDEKLEYSRQAFSKGRLRIRAEAFKELFEESVKQLYAEMSEITLLKGYRVSAIDGVKYNLPNTAELSSIYGAQKTSGEEQVQAQGSCLYDVLNGILIDVVIAPINANERNLAKQHLEVLTGMSYGKEIVLFDRGYPSEELVCLLEECGLKYLMRCTERYSFREVNQAEEGDHFVERKCKNGSIKMRVVKVTNEKFRETLITNLAVDEFSTSEILELYRKRWGVETVYNDIKNKLEIENFSGMADVIIRQDFYATMLMSNMIAAAEIDHRPMLEAYNSKPSVLYAYKLNRAATIRIIREEFYGIMLETSQIRKRRKLRKIQKAIGRNYIAIRPGRTFTRKRKHLTSRFSGNMKSCL